MCVILVKTDKSDKKKAATLNQVELLPWRGTSARTKILGKRWMFYTY